MTARNDATRLPVCEAHSSGELEWPDLTGGCTACRIAYLEAQESLLEEWQQRAKSAEDAAAEIQRPLDAQMARLNETVTRLNVENERLRSNQSAIERIKFVVRCGGECPQDWLCNDIPEVQKAMCEALYGDPSNADPDAIGWYVEAVQKMAPEELKREWRFEDGWLEVIKLRPTSTKSDHG